MRECILTVKSWLSSDPLGVFIHDDLVHRITDYLVRIVKVIEALSPSIIVDGFLLQNLIPVVVFDRRLLRGPIIQRKFLILNVVIERLNNLSRSLLCFVQLVREVQKAKRILILGDQVESHRMVRCCILTHTINLDYGTSTLIVLGDCDGSSVCISILIYRNQLVCIGITHIADCLFRCQCPEPLRSDGIICALRDIVSIFDCSRSILRSCDREVGNIQSELPNRILHSINYDGAFESYRISAIAFNNSKRR